mgnify:CR=1 FL=1
MDGYERAKQIFELVITNFEKNRGEAQDKFLDNKNRNETALAHGYDMQVISYEHCITSLRMALTTLHRSKMAESTDAMVKAHEQTVEWMINNIDNISK